MITKIENITRDAVIAAIRSNLKERSGRSWSVTGSRGSSWGWITIDAPGRYQTAQHVLKTPANIGGSFADEYEEVDTGQPNGHTPKAIRDILAGLLGLESVHHQGVSIPASSAHYREFLERSAGLVPGVIAQPYWD